MNTKKKLKETISKMRDSLSVLQVNGNSEAIFKKVYDFACYKNAKNIFIYRSFKNEVSTEKAIEQMRETKTLYLPKINEKDEMVAVKLKGDTKFTIGKYGIEEPLDGEIADKNEIDLCIVPGIAFDKMGGRTGYGKAYYDIYLRGTNMYKLAVCYDFQLIEYIPVDLLDVNMDAVVTEKRTLILNSEALIYT